MIPATKANTKAYALLWYSIVHQTDHWGLWQWVHMMNQQHNPDMSTTKVAQIITLLPMRIKE